jgi:hypothetical protein
MRHRSLGTGAIPGPCPGVRHRHLALPVSVATSSRSSTHKGTGLRAPRGLPDFAFASRGVFHLWEGAAETRVHPRGQLVLQDGTLKPSSEAIQFSS